MEGCESGMECKKYNLKMDPEAHIIQLPSELADYLGGPGTELVMIWNRNDVEDSDLERIASMYSEL